MCHLHAPVPCPSGHLINCVMQEKLTGGEGALFSMQVVQEAEKYDQKTSADVGLCFDLVE